MGAIVRHEGHVGAGLAQDVAQRLGPTERQDRIAPRSGGLGRGGGTLCRGGNCGQLREASARSEAGLGRVAPQDVRNRSLLVPKVRGPATGAGIPDAGRRHPAHSPSPSAARAAAPLPQEKAEPEEKSPSFAGTVEEPKKECTPRLDWAGLLRRTFALDVWACVRCGGRRRVLAYLTAPGGVRAIVEHLGLPSWPTPLAPAQGPAQLAGCGAPSSRAAPQAHAPAASFQEAGPLGPTCASSRRLALRTDLAQSPGGSRQRPSSAPALTLNTAPIPPIRAWV